MSFRQKSFLVILPLILFVVVSCQSKKSAPESPAYSTVQHPEWAANLSIYEVNLRQYTESGTFKAFEQHLPRLKDMGVGILWFMPIHPIGEKNRKGNMGSYYSVKDYKAVGTEYGSLDDFKALVKQIHEMGMYVIIDWVANHTAWDNPMTQEHPEWFTKDEHGNFMPPVPDWSDVVDLNYDNLELRAYMIDAMKFWIKEADIDGFRCDVAEMVPIDFWNNARAELDKIKPVFMLAEAESPVLHEKAFDMTYCWKLYWIMNGIADGRNSAADVDTFFAEEFQTYPKDAYRMYFTTNHDENSWNGTVFERMGNAAEIFAVFTATISGMPLVYSGQEAGLDKRLNFFEKDPIEWKAHPFQDLYATLFKLKKRNQALWNGEQGGNIIRVPTSDDKNVFAFIRQKNDDKIFAVFNLSKEEQNITLNGDLFPGNYTDVFTHEKSVLSTSSKITLKPWGYRVLEKF
ncbi:alpha-glucosidase C-terminal domain-containing protein [bacterium]|nr:alpha-glucosidase C-terminal domain-containing protein [bacterium]